jgi:hypothetical protein
MKRRDFLQSCFIAAAATAPGLQPAYAVVAGGTVPDIPAVTGDGRDVLLKGADVSALARQMRGTVLIAGEDGYELSRRVLNPSFDKRPAVIARPADAKDVQAVVRFARAHGLLVAVKCGGHSHSGQSTCDRGLQIDLTSLRGVTVDAGARRARVLGGTLLGQVDGACLEHGLVTPLGTVSHTGVGGLTTGGGFGRLARRFGLAIDNLESVEVVTGNGELLRASERENPDLFWGVRGGGGNFGVVTEFEFRLHPFERSVVAGTLSFPMDRARDSVALFAQLAATAPDELYFDPALILPPGGAPGFVSLEVCYSGPAKDAEAALAPIRKLGKPTRDNIRTVDYLEAQRANDTGDNRMMGTYLKGGFIEKFPEALTSAIVDGIRGDPGRLTLLFFQHCGGAASRVAENATAFAQRASIANMMIVTGWRMDSGNGAPHVTAARDYWKTLEPFTSGFYVNDLPREVSATDINRNYRGNYPRLVAVKKKHDPTNLFRLNANVSPA